MQIRLDELLENMKSDAKDGGEDTGLFDKQEEGPKRVASCPPTPRRKSGVIEAAIEAATQTLADEQTARMAEEQSGPSEPEVTTTPAASVTGDSGHGDSAEPSPEDQFDDSDTGRPIEPPPEPRITAERAAIDPEMVAALEAEAAAEQAAAAAQADANDEQVDQADEDESSATAKKPTLSQRLAGAAVEAEAEHYVEGSLGPLQGKKEGRVEHSGLIDVRQMAAAYLSQNAPARTDEDEFGGGPIPMPISGESTSPLLLPQRQEPSSNKGLLIALGVVGLLAIITGTALATSLFIDRGGRSVADMSAAQVAAFCEDEGYVAAHRPGRAEERAEPLAVAPVPVPVQAEPSESSADRDQAEAVSADSDRTSSEPSDSPSTSTSRDSGDDDQRSRRERDRERDRSDRDRERTRSSREREVASRDDTATSSSSSSSTDSSETAKPVPSKPAGEVDANGVKCDEVLCLVEGKGCCGNTAAKRPGGSAPSTAVADANLPTRPERSDISGAMDKLQARLQSCGDRFGTRGAVSIKFKIDPSGKVSSASTSAGNDEFQSCVSKTMRGARFPATKEGASVTYPVVLR